MSFEEQAWEIRKSKYILGIGFTCLTFFGIIGFVIYDAIFGKRRPVNPYYYEKEDKMLHLMD